MLRLQESISIGAKTTMRIGGVARYFAELQTREDVEQAVAFAREKQMPLIVLGGGSNTIFADGTVEALVVRLKNDKMTVDGNTVKVGAGKILASLLVDLAKYNLDLSALTGIPGMLGGALFGNAGQGPKGIWLDAFVVNVTAYIDSEWKTLTREECNFRYRESVFKDKASSSEPQVPPIIWEATLTVPSRPEADVKDEIESLLKKRFETQPHLKTAGSCFKALPDGTPAWKLIDAAGLRGTKIGGIQIAEKHANFLLNVEKGTFKDAMTLTELIRKKVPEIAGIEMRFYGEDGKIAA